MRISGNELVVTVTKACVGKGVPRGIAQDMGQACLQLALAGKPPLHSVLSALDDHPSSSTPPLEWSLVGDRWEISNLNALASGPSMVDFAQLVGAKAGAKANKVDYPDLIWGLAKATNSGFRFEEEGQSVSVKLDSDAEALNCSSALKGFDVDSAEWTRLNSYAALIMVPADEQNRADAGAGLTDND